MHLLSSVDAGTNPAAQTRGQLSLRMRWLELVKQRAFPLCLILALCLRHAVACAIA